MSTPPQAARSGMTKAVATLRRKQPIRRRQITVLRNRVTVLEREMQETRRLNRRVAELTDIVQELLLPVATRDEQMLRERLEKYSSSL